MGRSDPGLSQRRIGLLACDSIWEPLRGQHGDYAEMYGALLQAAGARFELQIYPVHAGKLPAAVSDCDGWLISGSRAGVHDPLPWIAPLQQFVRDAYAVGTPLVGVCFGHQLLAQALGGQVERAAGGWGLGNLEISVLATPSGGLPPPAPFRLFMAHQDQVVALPPDAHLLATAAHCPHAMFAISDRVLGIQPHPEFTASFMVSMTEEVSFLVPEPLRQRALESYRLPVDGRVVGNWMADFLALRR